MVVGLILGRVSGLSRWERRRLAGLGEGVLLVDTHSPPHNRVGVLHSPTFPSPPATRSMRMHARPVGGWTGRSLSRRTAEATGPKAPPQRYPFPTRCAGMRSWLESDRSFLEDDRMDRMRLHRRRYGPSHRRLHGWGGQSKSLVELLRWITSRTAV